MRRISAGRVLAVVALALLVAGPVSAQDKELVVAGGWAPQIDFAGGGNTTVPLGVMFNVAVPIAPKLQVVGDFGWARKSEGGATLNFLTATGGVRYAIPTKSGGSASPFVEGLVGLGYLSGSIDTGDLVGSGSATGIAFGFGGGVDVKANATINLRIQANYFLNRISGVNLSEVRFGIGISSATKM